MQKENRSPGKLFNKNIPPDEYTQAVQAVEIQMRMQLGENYSQLQKFFDLNNLAAQRLVMLSEADKRKIRISDSELTAQIQKDPSFYRKGVFDNSIYEQIIKYGLHIQPRAYEEITRQNLKIKKLVEDVTREVTINDAQIRANYSKENEEISVYYISSIPADFALGINPSENEIAEYFAKNSTQFKRPLSFNLEYLILNSTSLTKNLTQRMEKKDALEKIAQDNNLSIKETGLFAEADPIPGIGWSQEITKSLNQLKTGELLGPLEIEKKSYVFRIKEKKEPFIPEFKDITEEIKADLVKTKSREMAKSKIDECAKKIKDTLASGKDIDFEKIAQEQNLKSAATGLFKFGSYIESIGASDIFFNTAGKLTDNSASEVIELPSGFYIIKLKDKPALDEKKFSEDKAKFGEKMLNDKKQEYFDKFLKELTKKAQAT